VADRAFPSRTLFRTLRALHWGWTVRLRAPLHVHADGQDLLGHALLARAWPSGWTVWPDAYGWGTQGVPATLVVGRALPVLPLHQRTAGTPRHRACRQAERQRYAGVRETDACLVLCPTHSTRPAAVRSYRGRWATEGSYRDAQRGWDGQHGWDLEPVLRQARSRGQVERVVGLWALGTLLRTWIGGIVPSWHPSPRPPRLGPLPSAPRAILGRPATPSPCSARWPGPG
jgi:hypothetical protein